MKTFNKVFLLFLFCHAKESQGDTAGAAAAGGEGAEGGGAVAVGGTNTRLWTGNAAIDGGILGLGAGLLGGAVLGGLLTSLVQCQCDYSLTWHDKYGRVQGACRSADYTGQVWCYSTGQGCADARHSVRFPNNPWSYQACQISGKK